MTNIPLNYYISPEQAKYGKAASADIASATYINLEDSDGEFLNVTGTTTIAGIWLDVGHKRTVKFTGACTLTYGAATIITPGAIDLVLAANDIVTFKGEASNVVRVIGITRTAGGVSAVSGQTVSPRVIHTGGITVTQTTDGNDTTPSVTETYLCELNVPYNCTITGIALFNGTAVAGNVTAYLYDSAGVNLGASASTAQSGTDAFQRFALSAAYSAKGPATYVVGFQFNNTSARFNSHIVGNFGASKKTGETYGTPTTVTAPSTFTTALGPIASLY